MRPLKETVQRFQERPNFRDRCFSGLQINNDQIPKIIDGVDLLAQDLNLDSTERSFK